MATKRSLGRQLIAIGLGCLAVIITLVLLIAEEAVDEIRASMRTQVREEAYRRVEFIRDRVVEAASFLPGRPIEYIIESKPSLRQLLAKEVSRDPLYAYINVVSPTGLIVASSQATSSRTPASHAAAVSSRPSDPYQRPAAELASFGETQRVLDYAVPIDVDERHLGVVCVGVSEELLERRMAAARSPVRRVVLPTGLACIVILTAAGVGAWWLIGQTRELDRTAAHQEHLAEVGKLTSGLVHEVRNPLNAMRMQIAVIGRKLSKPDEPNLNVARSQLGQLEQEVLRLQQLAQDFLAFGRPAHDWLETFDLRALILEVVNFVRPQFEQIGAQVLVEDAEGGNSRFVRMDRGKLRQVLLNLADNARQALVDGGWLTIRMEKATGRLLRIRFQDTGCGIMTDRLPRIFDAFYSTKEDGTGLGLAIAKQIVESAGGSIRAESEPGKGSCFEIVLPRHAGSSRNHPDEMAL